MGEIRSRDFFEEQRKRADYNFNVLHKCPVCGRFMKRISKGVLKDRYKCIKMTYDCYDGWEHE